MNQRGLAGKLVAFVIILSFTSGCMLDKPSTRFVPDLPTDIPSSAHTQFAQALLEDEDKNSYYADGSNANLIEQNMKRMTREQGGARTALGDQADTVFQEFDAAEIAMVAIMNDHMQTLSGSTERFSKAKSAPVTQMVRFSSSPPGSSLIQNKTVGVLSTLLIFPQMIADLPRDENGNSQIPPLEYDEKRGINSTAHAAMRATLHGSKMDVEVEMILNSQGPPAYQESTTGQLTIDLCPDAQGIVPLTIHLKNGYTLAGGGYQWEVMTQGTGHVNDEGQLSGYDISYQSRVGAQAGNSGKYVEMKTGFTVSGLDLGEGKVVTSHISSELIGASSQVAQEEADEAIKETLDVARIFLINALVTAEIKWTGGYCLEIRVADLKNSTKLVQMDSKTPFTASVWHKYDAMELTVPVIATLTDGKVALDPSGIKVPAPAVFTYQAPDEVGAQATVHLETRSRRGISEKNISFTTGFNKVDMVSEQSTIYGIICSLEKPFSIDTSIHYLGFEADFSIQFIPSSANAGTASYNKTQEDFGGEGITAHWEYEGPYQVIETSPGNKEIQWHAKGGTWYRWTLDEGHGEAIMPEATFIYLLFPSDTDECIQP